LGGLVFPFFLLFLPFLFFFLLLSSSSLSTMARNYRGALMDFMELGGAGAPSAPPVDPPLDVGTL